MSSATTTRPASTIIRRRWRLISMTVVLLLLLVVAGIGWRIRHDPFADEVRQMGGRYDSKMPYEPVGAVMQLLNRRPLPDIHRVQLTGTEVDDKWLHEHRVDIESLSYLNLSFRDTRVTDEGLAALRGLEGVHSLDLAGTGVTDLTLDTINSLPKLYGATIARTRISDSVLAQLSLAPNLQWLCIDSSQATPAGIAALSKCPRLRYLTVVGADDECAARLTPLTQLFVVRLQGESLTVDGLLALQSMQPLQAVHLIDSRLTFEEIKRLRSYLGGCVVHQWDQQTLDDSEEAAWK